ncbi:MAG TPA: DUF5676 family membrane protein [Candidatus Nanoarchaeia archaeon]|nr:DUF5676 family membrane protein [Candidatus Nanoarchaeia archaeon]
MKNELKPAKVGIALGIVFAIVSLICAILFSIIPEFILGLGNNLFHGLDLTQMTKSSISWGGVIIGVIEVFIIGFVGGWLFGVIYNAMNKA